MDDVRELTTIVDGRPSDVLIIPTDSHLIALGQKSLVAVRTHAGRESFREAAEALSQRRESEAAFLHDGSRCEWAPRIDDARFEGLVEDLLTVERGVEWVRQVGATRESDDGRDLIAEWNIGADRGGEVLGGNGDISLIRHRQVLVQIKIRTRGVGRSDVPNLRDTLDHYRCDGLLLVAFPRVTVPLMDHLAEMRRRGQWWVDWWCKAELETRLRRHPEVARRYSDVVSLEG